MRLSDARLTAIAHAIRPALQPAIEARRQISDLDIIAACKATGQPAIRSERSLAHVCEIICAT